MVNWLSAQPMWDLADLPQPPQFSGTRKTISRNLPLTWGGWANPKNGISIAKYGLFHHFFKNISPYIPTVSPFKFVVALHHLLTDRVLSQVMFCGFLDCLVWPALVPINTSKWLTRSRKTPKPPLKNLVVAYAPLTRSGQRLRLPK